MFGITVAVQTDDGGGLVITRWRRDSGKAQRLKRLAKRVEAFLNTDDVGCERCRFLYVQREQVGSFLVSDQEQILESVCDEQRDISPIFLEQRVGATGGGKVHGERR